MPWFFLFLFFLLNILAGAPGARALSGGLRSGLSLLQLGLLGLSASASMCWCARSGCCLRLAISSENEEIFSSPLCFALLLPTLVPGEPGSKRLPRRCTPADKDGRLGQCRHPGHGAHAGPVRRPPLMLVLLQLLHRPLVPVEADHHVSQLALPQEARLLEAPERC